MFGKSIFRGGFWSFIKNSIISRILRYLRLIRLAIFCGVDIILPFDTRWPDESRFLPLKPISTSAQKNKPKICLVTANMSSGGAERQVAALAIELNKLGYEVRVRVLHLDRENGHYLSYLKAQGIGICVPKIPGFSDIVFMKEEGMDFTLIRHLPSELRIDALALTLDLLRQPVDIVHCYLDRSCCYGGFAALLSGTPCVRFSWRNVNPKHFEFFRDWMFSLYKFLLSFSRIRVENNTLSGAADYAQWLGLSLEQIEVIPNGLSPEMFCLSHKGNTKTLRDEIGIDSQTPMVVSIGRLFPQKRPLDLPGILLVLRKKIPLATFIHVGVGPLKNDLQKLISTLGLGGTLQEKRKARAMFLLGQREDIFDILRVSDVLLLTSVYEGMPNVIMEAMFMALPVVATRAGGVTELMRDGVDGFLHDVGDIPAMAQSLEILLSNPALRKKMGDSGRQRIISEFTIEHLVGRLTKAYINQCFAINQ